MCHSVCKHPFFPSASKASVSSEGNYCFFLQLLSFDVLQKSFPVRSYCAYSICFMFIQYNKTLNYNNSCPIQSCNPVLSSFSAMVSTTFDSLQKSNISVTVKAQVLVRPRIMCQPRLYQTVSVKALKGNYLCLISGFYQLVFIKVQSCSILHNITSQKRVICLCTSVRTVKM